MSVKAMAWAWEQDLKTGPKLVLVALADHSDGSGICWPGHDLIVEKCGLSRQTVVEHIGALEAAGLVRAERTRSGPRAGKTRYFLNLDAVPSRRPAAADVNVGTSDIERSKNEQSMSGIPTLVNVGFSPVSMSGVHPPYKEEPKAIEPTPLPPKGGDLLAVHEASLRRWFEDRFWAKYPKRVNKAQALAELERLRPDAVLLEAIAAGLDHRLEAQRHAHAKREFFAAWPDPHRWLRKRRWEDRFDVPRETEGGVPKCRCGKPGITGDGRRWYCAAHDPDRRPS